MNKITIIIGLMILLLPIVQADLTEGLIDYHSFDNVEMIRTCNVISESIIICNFHLSDLDYTEMIPLSDEFVMWNRTLTEEDIKYLWNEGEGYNPFGCNKISESIEICLYHINNQR